MIGLGFQIAPARFTIGSVNLAQRRKKRSAGPRPKPNASVAKLGAAGQVYGGAGPRRGSSWGPASSLDQRATVIVGACRRRATIILRYLDA
jgi:hypothetical protein